MRIYAIGDSFTAGEELLDFTLKGFPGYKTIEEVDNPRYNDYKIAWLKQKAILKWNQYNRTWKEWILLERSWAWPALLEQLDSRLEVENNSYPGASITGMAHRAVSDILLAKHQGRPFDKVFIQITSANRFEMYDSTLKNRDFIMDGSLTHGHWATKESLKGMHTVMLKYQSDLDFVIKYLYTLSSLKAAIVGLTGAEPILVASQFHWVTDLFTLINEDKELKDHPNLRSMIEYINIPDIKLIMNDIHVENKFLYNPCRHYEQRTHYEFAKAVYDMYIKNEL